MGRISISERVEPWANQIGRQCSLGRSVAKFSAEEEISGASFYRNAGDSH